MRYSFLILASAAALMAQASYEDIVKGPGANWLTYAGNYQGWRDLLAYLAAQTTR